MGKQIGSLSKAIFLGPATQPWKDNAWKKPGTPGLNADKALAAAAMEILHASRGTRQAYFKENLEPALQGRVPEARLPDVAYAAENALRTGSDERRATESALATSGLSRTPLGADTRAQTELAGNTRAGTTAADFLNSFFFQAPNAVLGQAQQTGLSGLGTVSNIGALIAAQRAQARGAAIGGTLAGAGSLAGAGIGGAFSPSGTTPMNLPARYQTGLTAV